MDCGALQELTTQARPGYVYAKCPVHCCLLGAMPVSVFEVINVLAQRAAGSPTPERIRTMIVVYVEESQALGQPLDKLINQLATSTERANLTARGVIIPAPRAAADDTVTSNT